jgi:two-component system CheB/CheR fusion protein
MASSDPFRNIEDNEGISAEPSAEISADGHAPGSGDDRMRDIAQLRQKVAALEAELAQRNRAHEDAAKLAAIVASSEDAIASKDLNGVVTSWNPGAERMFGYKAEEIIGRPITLIIPPELQQDEQMILNKIRRGERIEHFETVRLTKSGRRLDVWLSISPVKDQRGRVTGAAKIVRDVTQRKQTEAALRHAEKLAANGQLAAMIAHEINNPMQALTNLLALASYRTSADPETNKLIGMADAEVKRMARITRQMLSLYRESAAPVPLKITEVLEDTLDVLAMNLRANHIKVERRYEEDGPIQGFPVEMRQLFVNLLTNAAEAIGQDGRILIHVKESRDWARLERHGVRIVIADNGPGIQPEMLKNLFDPFFTTKTERGTGLGLWVVKGIVTKHEGSIRFRTCTEPKRSGTMFSIFLPGDGHPLATLPRATAGIDAA